uniref:Homeobox-leucine zipper protein HOX10 n=2 Tax=Anthurium amnicola TaxID=1678845 RepID=A0A1D1YM82_9ARAE
MIKLEGQTLDKDGDSLSQDTHLLQLCSGVDVNTNGACFQLVFAPVDELFTDALLLPSGFRIIPLDANSDGLASTHTLDLASSLEVTTTTNRACGGASMNTGLRSVLTIAFQFPYEVQLQDSTAMMARQHMHGIISAVQRISAEVSNPCLGLHVEKRLIPGISEAAALANWICQSYSFHMGVELLQSDGEAGGSLVKMLWHHRDALLCCSLQIKPGFTCANQAGHDMLETTLVGLRDITLDRIFDEPGQKTL